MGFLFGLIWPLGVLFGVLGPGGASGSLFGVRLGPWGLLWGPGVPVVQTQDPGGKWVGPFVWLARRKQSPSSSFELAFPPASFRAQRNTNIKEYFLETGFEVLSAVPGRRDPLHDCIPMGLGWFFDDPGSEECSFMFHSFMCLFGALIFAGLQFGLCGA